MKHSDEIMMAWSTQLDDKWGQAVNLNTKAAWDKLLPVTVAKYDMYAVDETSVTGTEERATLSAGWEFMRRHNGAGYHLCRWLCTLLNCHIQGKGILDRLE